MKTVVGETANVYDMLGNPTTEKGFKDRYLNASSIHAYEISREGSMPIEGESSEAISRAENVVIYGYLGWQEGLSEPTFQAEVDAICAAFDPPRLRQFLAEAEELDLDTTGLDWSAAPKVEGPRIGKLGQVLVHYVRISVEVTFSPIF
jgi:hypothetical protein